MQTLCEAHLQREPGVLQRDLSRMRVSQQRSGVQGGRNRGATARAERERAPGSGHRRPLSAKLFVRKQMKPICDSTPAALCASCLAALTRFRLEQDGNLLRCFVCFPQRLLCAAFRSTAVAQQPSGPDLLWMQHLDTCWRVASCQRHLVSPSDAQQAADVHISSPLLMSVDDSPVIFPGHTLGANADTAFATSTAP
jgi:hypothetical protein